MFNLQLATLYRRIGYIHQIIEASRLNEYANKIRFNHQLHYRNAILLLVTGALKNHFQVILRL